MAQALFEHLGDEGTRVMEGRGGPDVALNICVTQKQERL